MLEMEWAQLPDGEKLAIADLLADPWVLVGGDQGIEEKEYRIERFDLFNFTYTSDVSVDDLTFSRTHTQGQQEWIYFLDASWTTGVITIAGLGEPSDETATQMYLRIAAQTCERLLEKITCENAFKASKLWLKKWSEVGFIETFLTILKAISSLLSMPQAQLYKPQLNGWFQGRVN